MKSRWRAIVCGWGTHGAFMNRGWEVAQGLWNEGHTLHALRVTKDGHPGHPLYVGYAVQPRVWEGQGDA